MRSYGEKIEFVKNFVDHSTNQGYQFEFFCDRCQSGFRTKFQPSTMGTITNVLNAASSLLGGVFGSAANIGSQARFATWEMARDNAFVKAVSELKPDFIQCPRCSSWVCRRGCWNNEKGLCKQCAPDLGVEMATAQASRTVEEIWAHSKVAEADMDMLKEENWRVGVRATCPSCNAPLKDNAKFCPECGSKIQGQQHCIQSGAKLASGAKFCGECGAKV